jgi:hypothetical protein
MTPLQIAAFCFLIARREDLRSHRDLHLMVLARSDDAKAIDKQLKQWEKENT